MVKELVDVVVSAQAKIGANVVPKLLRIDVSLLPYYI